MKRIIACILLAALLLTLCGCSSADQILDALDGQKYEKAAQLYQKKIKGDGKAEAEFSAALTQRLQENYDRYNNGEISFEEAGALLDSIQRSGVLNPFDMADAIYALEELRESKVAFTKAEALKAEGKFLEAAASYRQVISDDVNYDTAVTEAAACQKSYLTAVQEKGRDYLNQGKYAEAYAILQDAATRFPQELALQTAVSEAVTAWVDALAAQAQALVKEEKFQDAYYLLLEGQEQVPDPARLDGHIASVMDTWKTTTQNKAKEAFGDNKNYEAAIQILLSSCLPEEEIAEDLAFYESYKPIPLHTRKYTKKGPYLAIGNGDSYLTDMRGNTYQRQTVYVPWGDMVDSSQSQSEDDAYICYDLNGEYCSFTGRLYRPDITEKCGYIWDTQTTFKVYGDGVLLYEGPAITQATRENTEFSLDVTGVRELKIVMRGVWKRSPESLLSSREPMFCATNLTIQK